MFDFFSRRSNNTDHHLSNGNGMKEELEPLISSDIEHAKPLTNLTKIKPFSLCSSADSSFQKQREDLINKQIDKSAPPPRLSLNK